MAATALRTQDVSLPPFLLKSRKSSHRSELKPILLPIAALRPTQAAVGMRAVAAKREKVETRAHKRKKIARFLERRPIPAVLGPQGNLYIVDHHHLSLALLQSEVTEAFVKVIDEWAHLPHTSFWKNMRDSGRAYLFDEKGDPIRPAQLPGSICGLRCDHFRDLAWSVREAGGFEKTWKPYAEFRWAEYFRKHIAVSRVRRDYDGAFEQAMRLARDKKAAALPGYVGKS